MFELKPFDPKSDRTAPERPRRPSPGEPKQRRMMVIALTLLLVALGFVLPGSRFLVSRRSGGAETGIFAGSEPARRNPSGAGGGCEGVPSGRRIRAPQCPSD